MIADFITLLPEEILYSGFAEYALQRDILDLPYTAVEHLLGNRRVCSIDFPLGIESFTKMLPPKHLYQVDYIINKHTLFPAIAPFLPKEKRDALYSKMISLNTDDEHQLKHTPRNKINSPKFCPLCIDRDKMQFGRPFWRRAHQLPYVHVCIEHNVWLETCVNAFPKSSYKFIHPKQATASFVPAVLGDGSADKGYLLLAQDATWLLERAGELNLDTLFKCYQRELKKSGYMTLSGKLNAPELVSAFKHYYGVQAFQKLDVIISERSINLLKIARGHNDYVNPAWHLLLVHFLGSTLEGMVSQRQDHTVFEGPWACYNEICPKFQQAVIKDFELNTYYPKGGRRQRASVTCPYCGFSYTIPEDYKQLNPMKPYSRINRRGHLWEAELKRLWGEENTSTAEICRILNTHRGTVLYYVVKLQLEPDLSVTAKIKEQGIESDTAETVGSRDPEVKIAYYKEVWLDSIKAYPEKGISELQGIRAAAAAYRYLLRHQREWLMSNRPERKNSASKIDWHETDNILTRKVVEVGVRMLRTSPPVFVTRYTIAREVGESYTSLLCNKLHRLPRTAKYLRWLCDDNTSYRIRRIKHAAHELEQEGCRITKWRLIRRAGVMFCASLPEIAAAINVELENRLSTENN